MEKPIVIEMYYQMLRIRMVEEAIAQRYQEQEMRCPVHLCIGQEATAVGACIALTEQDYVLSGHRSHGHYLAKGGSLKSMIAELYGKETGCSRGKGGSMHLVDRSVGFLGATPIVGSTIPIAVGTAFGSSLRGEKRVTICFFGEGATEEGAFHEALNFAALRKLPVIFVCENNLYSVYSPIEVRQPENRDNVAVSIGHGVQGFRGDGNNVREVYDRVAKAVERARMGQGPTFLEFQTYRWREHCGANFDNDLGYRTEKEYREWKNKCPLSILRNNLMEEGALEPEQMDGMIQGIQKEIEEAFQFAKASPFPKKEALMRDVYVD